MRDPERPVGRVVRSGQGVGRLASTIHFFVIYEGTQHVFVDESGNVYCVGEGTCLAMRQCAAHPAWLVGTYYDGVGKRLSRRGESIRALITDDLLARVGELWKAAA